MQEKTQNNKLTWKAFKGGVVSLVAVFWMSRNEQVGGKGVILVHENTEGTMT